MGIVEDLRVVLDGVVSTPYRHIILLAIYRLMMYEEILTELGYFRGDLPYVSKGGEEGGDEQS